MNESKFLINFFLELEKNNIKYCVLRNYITLPSSLNGSDLDILIAKNDITKFYKILDIILKNNDAKIITKYGKLTPRICIAGNIDGELYGLQLDVHEGILPYKIFEMFSADFLLSRVEVHNNIFVANDNDSDLIAFLKEILNNSICKEKYFNSAKRVLQEENIYKNSLLSIYGEEFVEMLDKTINSAYSEKNIKKLSKLAKNNIVNNITKRIQVILSSIGRAYRFINPPGFTIAFLGTDGAGKSTIIDNITPALNEAVHNSLHYEHMRPNFIPNISQLFSKKKYTGPTTNPHAAKPSGFLGSLFRLFYYTLDYTFGYFIKIYPQNVKKSTIWFFDRYYYDYLIDPKRARISLPPWIIKAVSYIIPKPDLIICLGANPDVIFKRKPELPLSEIKIQVKKLKKFAEENKNSYWIDTEKSIEDSTNQVFNLIIDNMSKRY